MASGLAFIVLSIPITIFISINNGYDIFILKIKYCEQHINTEKCIQKSVSQKKKKKVVRLSNPMVIISFSEWTLRDLNGTKICCCCPLSYKIMCKCDMGSTKIQTNYDLSKWNASETHAKINIFCAFEC